VARGGIAWTSSARSTPQTALLGVEPGDTESHVALGNAYLILGRYDEAVAVFSVAIDVRPGSSPARHGRGLALAEKKEFGPASADFTEALRLRPAFDQARLDRGLARVDLKDYGAAVGDFSAVIRATPGNAWAFVLRARALALRGDAAGAVADDSEAIRLVPDYARPYRDRAWLWATCPDGSVRDAARAVGSATRACALSEWADPDHLATLSAALATSGDFPAAVTLQEDALALMAAGRARTEGRARLGLYRAKTPYRTPPGAPWPATGAETPDTQRK
jgi:tetratricopeptide (TPR) repeat protein